jgi:hypothetical protein
VFSDPPPASHTTSASIGQLEGLTVSSLEHHVSISWWRYLLAVGLILVSMISQTTVAGVGITGGPTIAALAALILLWPLLRPLLSQVAARGGSARLLGIELQINSLERKTEGDHSRLITELRVDVEGLRRRLNGAADSPASRDHDESSNDGDVIEGCIEGYRDHANIADWRERAKIDQRLIAGAERVSFEYLKDTLGSKPDRETAMAVAVVLGGHRASEDDREVAALLVQLVNFRGSERVRHRAASSIARRARRSDTTQEARRILTEGVASRKLRESQLQVRTALEEADRALALTD